MSHTKSKSYHDQIMLHLETMNLENMMTKQVILCPVHSTETWRVPCYFTVAPAGTQPQLICNFMIQHQQCGLNWVTVGKTHRPPKQPWFLHCTSISQGLVGRGGAVSTPPFLYLFLLYPSWISVSHFSPRPAFYSLIQSHHKARDLFRWETTCCGNSLLRT